MPSNALSKRRGPLRRPKVCHTAKNPGRCEPPPPPSEITCGLLNRDEPPHLTGETTDLTWGACNPDFDPTPNLVPEVTTVIGEVLDVEPGENCTDGNEVIIENPDEPGTETVTATFTWPDSSTCVARVSYEVTEEENGND